MSADVQLAFVIPAYREEANIAQVLSSIHTHVVPGSYEVVVCDNGSDDATVVIARRMGARVVVDGAATIGQLRNLGVAQTRAPVIVFLDADVCLTAAWARAIGGVQEQMQVAPQCIRGARGMPAGQAWIHREWFAPLAQRPARYLVTSHLITTRALFEQLGGFSAHLTTGEDCDFCARAEALGARLHHDPALAVVDHGYPADLRSFFRRELWHGTGDCESWQAFVRSPVAVAGALFMGAGLSTLVFAGLGWWWSAALSVSAMLLLCFLLSYKKRRRASALARVQHALLCGAYLAARGLAAITALGFRGRRHQRRVVAT